MPTSRFLTLSIRGSKTASAERATKTLMHQQYEAESKIIQKVSWSDEDVYMDNNNRNNNIINNNEINNGSDRYVFLTP